MIGQTISHYRILEKLGGGGMGIVYKARDLNLDRVVALKFLTPDLTRDSEAKSRLIREAKAASSLDHPNICTVHDIGETEDGALFFAMAYHQGQTLDAKIRQGPLAEAEIIAVALQIAEGLQQAHDRGIIHRDMKPENVVVSDEGAVKILDFGLAKLKEQHGLTQVGSTVGTIAYASPEQVRGEEIDPRTDLWSLGVVIYQMLTGVLPFRGEHQAAFVYEILNSDPPPVRHFRPDVSDNVVDLVSRLLQKDRGHRIDSAETVIRLLQSPSAVRRATEGKKSIAVLYFENMSSEKDNEYLCAGIAEDLITDLSQIQGFKVIPRSDVRSFRHKGVLSRQVGEILGVKYIVEGSVRRAGNRLRITAQLIDVGTGFQLWAERYDRLIEDIFDIQIEVSRSIAEALQVSVTSSEKQLLAKRPTDDLRAYDFYMRGTELLSRRGKSNNEASIQMFTHALSIDPRFALAYVGLAEAYSNSYVYYRGGRLALEHMMDVNEKALRLDPELVEARFGIGMVCLHQKRFPEARENFEHVIRLREDFYPVYYWFGLMSWFLEDFDTAVRCFDLCSSIKPYSEEPWEYLRIVYRLKGNAQQAEAAEDAVIRLGERKLLVNPDDATLLSRLACTYAVRGERMKAREMLTRALQIDPEDGLALWNCACASVYLGEKNAAISYLESALRCGIGHFVDFVRVNWDLRALWNDPRFEEAIAKYSLEGSQ